MRSHLSTCLLVLSTCLPVARVQASLVASPPEDTPRSDGVSGTTGGREPAPTVDDDTERCGLLSPRAYAAAAPLRCSAGADVILLPSTLGRSLLATARTPRRRSIVDRLSLRGKSAPTDAIAVASANSQAPDPDQALFGWIVDTDDDSESGSESESDSCDESGRDSGRDSAASDYYDAED